MGALREFHKQWKEAVASGTETVENFHRQVANWPLDELEKIEQAKEPVGKVREYQDMALGGLYGFVRSISEKTHEAADMIIDQVEPENKGPAA